MSVEKELEKAFELPARALEATVASAETLEKDIVSKRPFLMAEEYFNTLGPGLTTGAADDDPSGIATYSQTGAQYGFQLLWLSLFTFPLMATVQEMVARMALATGKGLAANIRTKFPVWALYTATFLLFIANTFNLGADLGAMAKVVQMFLPDAPLIILVMTFSLIILMLQIFTTYARYAKYLKYLTLSLFSYVAVALLVHMDWRTVFWSTLIPHITFSKDQLLLICAILGTTISPYLFFWQPAQEVEEGILRGKTTVAQRRETSPRQINDMRKDVWFGMFYSNAVMFFIIAACAATLAAHGITNIQTADQAAQALRPLAGNAAYLLFAIGIIGTGMLAIPVLAGSAAYAVSESFKWNAGLYRKLKDAYAFYGVVIVSMLLGFVMNVVGFDPIKALIYSAVANGVIAPIILICIVMITSDRKIMRGYVNGPITRAIGWITFVLMTISGIAALMSLW